MQDAATEKTRGLSLQQLKPVTSDEDYIGVIAGAGTGKTRVIVERIAYLLEFQGVDPRDIIAFTFTNRAAKELQDRLKQRGLSVPNVGTFHSLAYLLSDSRPLVLSQEDADDVLLKNAKGLGIKGSASKLRKMMESSPSSALASLYWGSLRVSNRADFSMLLSDFYNRVCNGQHRFKHVIVDESQDTDSFQWKIVDEFKRFGAKTFCVGDIKQQIYEWRGANSKDFLDRCGNDYLLDKTWRFPKQIAAVHNSLCDQLGVDQHLHTEVLGEAVIEYEVSVEQTVHLLKNLHYYAPHEIAVLCRTNAQVERYTQSLKAEGYKVSERQGYRGLVMDTLKYLCNPWSKTKAVEDYLNGLPHNHPLCGIGKHDPESAKVGIDHWLNKGFVSPTVSSVLGLLFWDFHDGVQEIRSAVGDMKLRDGLAVLTLGATEVDYSDNGITVCTVHQAKGLEWPAVIAIPGDRSGDEEIRIALVQATRAQEILAVNFSETSDSSPLKIAVRAALGDS